LADMVPSAPAHGAVVSGADAAPQEARHVDGIGHRTTRSCILPRATGLPMPVDMLRLRTLGTCSGVSPSATPGTCAVRRPPARWCAAASPWRAWAAGEREPAVRARETSVAPVQRDRAGMRRTLQANRQAAATAASRLPTRHVASAARGLRVRSWIDYADSHRIR
jgi:hypothetical protein